MNVLIIPLTVVTEQETCLVIPRDTMESGTVSDILLDAVLQLDGAQATLFGPLVPEPFVLPPLEDQDEPTLLLTRPKQPSFITDDDLVDITEYEAPTTIRTRPTAPTFDDSSDVRPIGSTEEDDSGNVVLSLCRPKKGPIAIQPVMAPPRPTSRHATEQAIAS